MIVWFYMNFEEEKSINVPEEKVNEWITYILAIITTDTYTNPTYTCTKNRGANEFEEDKMGDLFTIPNSIKEFNKPELQA